MKTLGRLLGNVLVLLLTLAMIGGVTAMAVIYHYSRDLPDYSTLASYEPPIVTRLYAGDGRLMAEYATEKRIYVPLKAIPKRVINAFLSAEDKNFYDHTGVDIFGIARALRDNFVRKGGSHTLAGGSTITQQVVKNFLLSNERTLDRKIKEAILAFRISQAFSKDRILELYLNEIFLGNRSYGVAAAALNYFNKSLDELSVEEAALLAAMPKAPTNFNPMRHYERAKERRDDIINLMQQNGYITPEEAGQAASMLITLRTRDPAETVRADFFAEEVRRRLVQMYGKEVLYEGGLSVKTTLDPVYQDYADESLRFALMEYDKRHGYRGPVATLPNVDNWQEALTKLPRDKIELIEDWQLGVVLRTAGDSAVVGLENGGKGILALAQMKWAGRGGGEATKVTDIMNIGDVVVVEPVEKIKPEPKLETVPVVDEAAAAQPAAPLKIDPPKSPVAMVLHQIPQVNGALVAMDPHTGRVLAMSGGWAYGRSQFNRATQARRQPGSSFKPFVYATALESGFSPSTIIVDAPVELSQGAGLPTWKPQNYHDDYLGPTTLRVGLEKSRNAMTVRLAVLLGINRILKMGERMGIYDKLPRNFSVVLGSAETTLIRLTNAYCMIVNGGKKVAPSLIERIDDRNGKIIYRRDMRECKGCVRAEGDGLPDTLPPIPEDNRERVLDPRIAYQMTSILQGVVERGTATRAKVLGKPVAGKTGTTNDSRDTWFVGFSPDLVAGVFVGYDTPKTLGKKETGGAVALPGFIHFMQQALADKPSTPFRVPPGIQLVKVNLANGAPPTYDDPSAKVIYEAFVNPDPPIYIPPDKDAPAADAKTADADKPLSQDAPREEQIPDPLSEGGASNVPQYLDRQQDNTYPAQPVTPRSAPVHGTGGLY